MSTIGPSSWLALGAGVVFGWLAVPGPHLYDSPALVAGAWDLAATYPPGQPLHALLGRLAAVALPLGPVPWRVALLSAAGETAAAWVTGLVARELLHGAGIGGRWTEHARLAATVGALVAPPLVRQALRVEVYGPALALTAAGMLALVRWCRHDGNGHARLRVGALYAGLVTALHPPHAFAVVLWGLAVGLGARREILRRPRGLAWTMLGFVAGTATFLLLPLRELAGAHQWGEAATLDGLLRYVSGAPYHRNLGSGFAPEALFGAARCVLLAAGSGACAGVVVWALGSFRPGAPRRRFRLAVLAAAVLLVLPAALQPMDARIPDRVAYAAPAVVALLALGAAGFVASGRRWLSIGGLALVSVHPLALAALPHSIEVRSEALETLASSFVESPPPRAVALVTSDLATFGWRMAQSVDGARPDVAALPTGTIGEPWQWRALAAHPAIGGDPPPLSPPTDRAGLIRRAIARVGEQVAIASEKRHSGLGATHIVGPYVVRSPRSPSRSDGFRVAMSEARPFFGVTDGDAGNVGALLRNVALNRARRLLDAGRGNEALALHRLVLDWLPAEQRDLLEVDATAARPPIPVVHDPEALFDASAEDAVREAAVALWRSGRAGEATVLLRGQAARGDPRALLQLGWMALAEGRTDAARRALAAFEAADGSHRLEAGALRRTLAMDPRPDGETL